MDEMRRLESAVALNAAVNSLASIRVGALLFQARPDLGRFLVELTSPNVPPGTSEKLFDSSTRLVASGDNFLQALIDTLTNIQQRLEED